MSRTTKKVVNSSRPQKLATPGGKYTANNSVSKQREKLKNAKSKI